MQVVIYDIDGVSVYRTLEEASEKILSLYGKKLGTEACRKLADGRPGTIYSEHGGPRVELISDEKAERIRAKERELANSL